MLDGSLVVVLVRLLLGLVVGGGSVAEAGMQPLTVIKDSMYSATANRARALVAKLWRQYISFLEAAKNDSAAALSQHYSTNGTLVRPSVPNNPS
jgi:hypothetical protein